MLSALRDDALRSDADGFTLRLSLPWIRSLPLTSLHAVRVTVDAIDVPDVTLRLGDRVLPPAALADEPGWWFLQDRLVLQGSRSLPPGEHDVAVSFDLIVPYLQAGPDGPLALPFRIARRLRLDAASDAAATAGISRDVA